MNHRGMALGEALEFANDREVMEVSSLPNLFSRQTRRARDVCVWGGKRGSRRNLHRMTKDAFFRLPFKPLLPCEIPS